jgi:hypothetical protein
MSDTTPEFGEIWEDAEGCLMTRAKHGGWYCTLTSRTVPDDDPVIAHPLRRAFDVEGNFVMATNRLRYPNGSNVDPDAVAAAQARRPSVGEEVEASNQRQSDFFRDNPRTEATE